MRRRVVRLREFINSSPIGFFPLKADELWSIGAAINLENDEGLADPRPVPPVGRTQKESTSNEIKLSHGSGERKWLQF